MANTILPSVELQPVNSASRAGGPQKSFPGAPFTSQQPALYRPASRWVLWSDIKDVLDLLANPKVSPPRILVRDLPTVQLEAERLFEVANAESPPALPWSCDLDCDFVDAAVVLTLLKQHVASAVTVCRHQFVVLSLNQERDPDEYQTLLQEHQKLKGILVRDVERFRETRIKCLGAGSVKLCQACEADESACFKDFIDYITATLVKILVRTIDGPYWTSILVAIMAKVTVLLKDQTPTMISKACEWFNADFTHPGEPESREGRSLSIREHIPPELQVCQDILLDLLGRSVLNIPNSIFRGFQSPRGSSLAVYGSSITGEQIMVSSQFDGAIETGSQASTIRITQAAFQVCREAWGQLEREPQPTPTKSCLVVSVEWNTSLPGSNQNPTAHRMELRNLRRLVAGLVPYSMSCGAFAVLQDQLETLFRFSFGGLAVNPLGLLPQPEVFCEARIRIPHILRGKKYEKAPWDRLQRNKGALLLANRRAQDFLKSYPHAFSMRERGPGALELEDMSTWNHKKRTDVFRHAREEYDKWVVDDNSIIVPYKRYAWGFLGVAACLVLGGLAVGLTIGERIPGVDPFNISVFCWGLAAFLLVMVKAIRVEHWSWNRFLRGEVACRSITEVVSVTGMDPQVLLVILLRLDDRMFLQTRGPFNTMFRRHTDDPQSGFSINVPIKATSAFEGGLIPVLVQEKQGVGLVFLRAHGWASYNSVEHSSLYENGIVCRDIEHPGSWAPDKNVPCYRLSRGDMEIVRVLGMFSKDCYLY